MRLNNDSFFKNFNKNYLLFIDSYYKNKSIVYIKNNINQQIKTIRLKNNINQIKERNIDYWLIRGWSYEDGINKIKEINNNRKKPKNNNILTIGYWLSRGFDKEDAINKISNIQKGRSEKATKTKKLNPNYKPPLSPFTEEFWIKNGMTDENEIEYKIKSQRKLNKEYWLNKGFNEEESIIKVQEYQKTNNEKRILKWKNNKDSIKYKKQFNTNIEYYLDKGFSLEESKQKLKERQTTFTLEKCVDKHGLNKGAKIYEERQKKWIKKMFNENTCMATGRSNISDSFIQELILDVNNNDISDTFLYGKNEKFIYDKLEKKR